MAGNGGTKEGGGTGAERRGVLVAFFLLLAVSLGIVLRILAPFFTVLLLALVTAGLIEPPYRALCRLLRGHRRAAALAVCLLLMAAVLAPMFITAQAVSREALGFYEMTTAQLSQRSLLDVLERRKATIEAGNRILAPLGVRLTPEKIYRGLATLGVKLGGFFYRQGVAMAKGLVRLGFGFFFWLLALFYLLVDGGKLYEWFFAVLPIPERQQRHVARRFIDMAGSLVIGNGLAGVIQGLVGGLVFAAVGVAGPVLWGVVMAVLAFIPVVGISLVYLPVTLVLLLTGQTARALEVFIPLALVATVVEYWLKPHLVGQRMQMHTLLVFLSLLGGMDAFGPVGLLIGPLMVTAFLTLIELYRESYHPLQAKPRGPAAGLDDSRAG